ncbi:MAG: sigma-70 family RNA polymerase sigma factor [bacterium]|nr:sigma-70 family RNA polymerase sigma factor [Acidimicrobiia bacterium]MCY4649687.1 sigma-70 family RNA polymerase sigma factor [bacterium]
MLPTDSSAWPPPLSEATAARDGDQAALTSILTKGLPRLVAFYRGQGLDLPDAEDVASDACEAIIRSLGKLRSPQAFEAWFWRVARSKFHDYLRKRHRPLPAPELETTHVLPDEHTLDKEEFRTVRVAYGRLAARDRELLWLREVEGLSYAEIGGRLFKREGSVRVAMLRARRRFEQFLKEEGRKPYEAPVYRSPSVLFMEAGDADRSQMAAALLRSMAAGQVKVFNGGSAPSSRVDPRTVKVLAERGIDIGGNHPVKWSAAMVEAAEVVVDLGEERLPAVTGKRYLRWEIESPAGKGLDGMRMAFNEIERRVWELMIMLEIEPRKI